jgi:hypothetical protein
MTHDNKQFAFVNQRENVTYWRCVTEPTLEIKVEGEEITNCVIKDEI